MEEGHVHRPQARAGKQPRQLSDAEIEEMLTKHEAWLNDPETGECANFYGKDLSGKDFTGKNLSEAIFATANLSKAILVNTNLEKAILNQSNLTGANLEGARLQKADLRKCILASINLVGVGLLGADLSETDISGASIEKKSFVGVTLKHAIFAARELAGFDFSNADLTSANFNNANLSEANFSGAILKKTDFNNAILIKAVFENADLEEARLRKADLSNSNLNGANLREAVFDEANITNASLKKATLSKAFFYDANLNGANLNEADLSYAFFGGASLIMALLRKADLTGTDFSLGSTNNPMSATNLGGADLTGSNLTEADFVRAILTDVNFQNTTLYKTNLTESQTYGMNLGGANVTNAILPSEIKEFKGLLTIEESSKIARKLYAWLLGVLAFSILSILSTKDPALLTNSATSPLPVLQIDIQMGWFHRITPFFILGLYLYFLLQLQHQWGLISKLPAVFLDGTLLHEKLYPWLLNTWVRNFFPHLKKKINAFSFIRIVLVVTLTWYAAPIVMFVFWARYLVVHDFSGNRVLIILASLALIAGIFFHYLAKATLQNLPIQKFRASFLSAILVIPICMFAAHLSSISTEGGPNPFVSSKFFDRFLRANFSGQDVSNKPDNWDPKNPTQGVKGVNLQNRNLRYLNAKSAFLVKANLTGADLFGAQLSGFGNRVQIEPSGANLTQAILFGATLSGADLSGALLNNSNLEGAKLKGSVLSMAQLNGAILTRADLTNAILIWSDFIGAEFGGAKLTGASISGSDFRKAKSLKIDQIKSTKGWEKALFDNELRRKLDFSDDEIRAVLRKNIQARNQRISEEELKIRLKKELKEYGIKDPLETTIEIMNKLMKEKVAQ